MEVCIVRIILKNIGMFSENRIVTPKVRLERYFVAGLAT